MPFLLWAGWGFIGRLRSVIRRNKGDIRKNGEVIRTSVDVEGYGCAFYSKSYRKASGLNFIRTLLRDIRKCHDVIRKS